MYIRCSYAAIKLPYELDKISNGMQNGIPFKYTKQLCSFLYRSE